jgi:cell division septation protein DedD
MGAGDHDDDPQRVGPRRRQPQGLREFADVLDMLDKSVAKLYAARTGLSQDEVLAMMEKETWMSADEAVNFGFADVASAAEKKPVPPRPRSIRASARTPVLLAASGDRQLGRCG